MNIIDEAVRMALADPRREIFDESVHGAVRAAIEHAVRRCAEVAVIEWAPSVGGYPTGEEIKQAILRAAGLEAK